MPEFDPGRLRRRITIERAGDGPAVPDPANPGLPLDDWAPIGTFWAEVLPLRGRELFLAQQVRATTTHRITIRDTASGRDIRPTDRVVHRGDILEIEAAIRVEDRGAWLEITAHRAGERVA